MTGRLHFRHPQETTGLPGYNSGLSRTIFLLALTASAQNFTVVVDANPGHAINSFDPDRALGSSIDVLSKTGIDKVYTPHVIQEALSAGWGPITYRNNSELRIAAWHWTENGAWSDPVNKSGYFTGSSELKEPLRYILSYALPHRGFSRGGGGASSTMQGSTTAYWKSNPYLTSRFTGESDALHPQWIVVDLGTEKQVSSVKITWADPYAVRYRVEYLIGKSAMGREPGGVWKTFPSGEIANAKGGIVTLPLGTTTRYLRVWMTESSNTCDLHGSGDVRNCVGYAMKEISVEGADRATITTSSVDPWHSSTDANLSGGAQHSGFDLFFSSGLTNNLPAMIPVTMLYGTPEDAAAEIAYIEKRGYPISYIEMGEEPDGKNILPEDYAALYIQWAKAIHKIDPSLKLGGPVFEGVNEDITVWPDAQGRTSWMGRFIAYLKDHGHLTDLQFVSFEHYPFEPCEITWKSLYDEPRRMKHILDVWRADGVPKEIPLMVTESHISWRLTGPMSTIFAALWLADSIGSFFEGGGAAYYHSPIQPQGVQTSCLGWASWSNFVADRDYNITGYTSLYFAAQMLNREWTQHRSGVHTMFPSTVETKDVSSYALHRPDGNWSILLVNRDEDHPHTVNVRFENGKRAAAFAGPVTLTTFGSEQYVWKNDGANSHADPDHPPAGTLLPGGAQAAYTLPKASITVLRGKVEGIAK
jgi:hypothetical protein